MGMRGMIVDGIWDMGYGWMMDGYGGRGEDG